MGKALQLSALSHLQARHFEKHLSASVLIGIEIKHLKIICVHLKYLIFVAVKDHYSLIFC